MLEELRGDERCWYWYGNGDENVCIKWLVSAENKKHLKPLLLCPWLIKQRAETLETEQKPEERLLRIKQSRSFPSIPSFKTWNDAIRLEEAFQCYHLLSKTVNRPFDFFKLTYTCMYIHICVNVALSRWSDSLFILIICAPFAENYCGGLSEFKYWLLVWNSDISTKGQNPMSERYRRRRHVLGHRQHSWQSERRTRFLARFCRVSRSWL